MLISPDLIEHLLSNENPIDKEYLTYLEEFDRILLNMWKDDEIMQSQSIQDVRKLLIL